MQSTIATSHIYTHKRTLVFTLYHNSPRNNLFHIGNYASIVWAQTHTHTYSYTNIHRKNPYNRNHSSIPIEKKALCSHSCSKSVHDENFLLLLLLLKTVTKYRFEMKIYDKIARVQACMNSEHFFVNIYLARKLRV